MESQIKTCQNCKQNFEIASEDFEFYEKIKVPAPTFCHLCRAQRRMAFRNERFLYKKKSDFSGEDIFCGYPPESWVKIYENNIWNSDSWDPMSYGKEIDFSKPFLSQVFDLIKEVPRPARSVIDMTNSDYCNNCHGGKNCYLVFNFGDAEDCLYGNNLAFVRDSVDTLSVSKSELIYDGFRLSNCSKVFFSTNCEECMDVYFSKNLRNCTNCFGCVNLRNKNYHIFNQPYSKEEYKNKFSEYKLNSFSFIKDIKQKSANFWLEYPNNYFEGRQNNNVTGEYIYNSKNVLNSYLVTEGENLKYSQYLYFPTAKDSYDYTLWGEGGALMYECLQVGNQVNNVKFSAHCWPNLRDSQYCIFCSSGSDLFGCVGLKNKQYCILNKQYTPDEYTKLVAQIIKHMDEMPYVDKKGRIYKYGEFFPLEFSPSPYNETMVQEHFPIEKNKAIEEGYTWRDSQERNISITKKAEELPDTIEKVSNSILKEIIECEHKGECNEQCTKAFKLVSAELAFYRKMNLPLPRLCSNCRHAQRLKQRNPLKLFKRQCQCAGLTSDLQPTTGNRYKNTVTHQHGEGHCENTFETTYSPDRPEIVYCEQCYQQEVV